MAEHYRWAKVHTDLLGEPKLRGRSNDERWAWVATILCATDSPERGTLLVAPGVSMGLGELAEACHVRPQEMAKYVSRWSKLGMIAARDDGTFWLPHYGSRQERRSPSDEPEAVLERVHRHRAKKKEAARNEVRNEPGNGVRNDLCNEDVTHITEGEGEGPVVRDADASLTTSSPAGAGDGAGGAPRDKEPPGNRPEPGEFDAWLGEFNAYAVRKGTRQRPWIGTEDLRRKYATRRRAFSYDQMVLAVMNLFADPFMTGDNANGRAYATPEWLLRNDEHVARYQEQPPIRAPTHGQSHGSMHATGK